MASQIERTPGVRDIVTRSAHALDLWPATNRRLYPAACLLCLVANLGYAHFRGIASDDGLQTIVFRGLDVRSIWNSLIVGVQVGPPAADTAMHNLFRIFGDRFLPARLPSVITFCPVCLRSFSSMPAFAAPVRPASPPALLRAAAARVSPSIRTSPRIPTFMWYWTRT
jgi:hypothetical protein